MEPHEESVGSCSVSRAPCADAPCAKGCGGALPERRWTVYDIDCPLLQPLPGEVRAFYEEMQRQRDDWEAELDRKIAAIEWRRSHPEEAALRDLERYTRGAGPAGPSVESRGWEPDAPEVGTLFPPMDLCEPSLCTDAQDAVDHLAWNAPIAVDRQSVADLAGSAPVGFNGGRWMAVDGLGRAFVVHIRRNAIRLLIFEAINPSSILVAERISPADVDPDVVNVAAPCIAISPSPSGTAFSIVFLGAPGQRFNRLFVTRGTLTPNNGIQRLTTTLLVRSPGIVLGNPVSFHDNLSMLHIVYSVAQTPLIGGATIAWACGPWSGARPYRVMDLGPGSFLPPTAGFPSVAARWEDGQLTVVVACKFSSGGVTGVYAKSAGGGSVMGLGWTDWDFLAGVDVLAGATGLLHAADPSVWVNDCGRFYVGYQEVGYEDGVRFVRPVLASNPSPFEQPRSWASRKQYPVQQHAKFVHISGGEQYMIAVWEARDLIHSGRELAPTWSGAIGVHSVGRSNFPDWEVVDPTSGWLLDLSDSGQDMLLFPTACISGADCFVAWLYLDRLQIPNNALVDLNAWSLYPAAVVEIFFVRGTISCV